MARLNSLWFSCVFFVIWVANLSGNTKAADEERKVYIVYMGGLPKRESIYSPSAHHANILQEVVDSSFLQQSLVRSYGNSLNAFAANLTEKEHQKLAAHDEVVSIFPSRTLQLHTTESWDFSGLPLIVNRNLKIEKDIIIGVIDTGIWPESKSFNDRGLGPPPKRWKGVCKGGKNFTCNNKIIGARHYVDDSARDIEGHGTHTASTAAGDGVKNASFYKLAEGTARGGVPSARIAVYKVCGIDGCWDEDTLAAFDDAIADGVDLLTISLGPRFASGWQDDVVAIGSFHAIEKGILTVNSAGNDGYDPASTTSVAPWLFTVAASTTKRSIVNKVVLGNGKEFTGKAIDSFKLNGSKFPLVYGKDASRACTESFAYNCSYNCLDKSLVKGKIVLCNLSSTSMDEVIRAGALGGIFYTGDIYDISFVLPSAASVLSYEQFELVQGYYNSTKNPTATIFPSYISENKVAPVIASFSSRGPNIIIPDILKPDITAPGVDILAAYSPKASPSDFASDKRSVKYNFISGTSMSCPHVAGVAAYVKSHHPDWSPSAIKSAIMTTAWRLNSTNTIHGDAEFSYGAGHIDPVKALNPGLVYQTEKVDYVKFLCSLKISNSTLRKILGDNTTTCPKVVTSTPRDLNYPALVARAHKNKGISVKFPRTVTNVGHANSTYKATIAKTPGINVTVKPSSLSFTALKERKSFAVFVSVGKVEKILSASLVWSDAVHTVRTPIVVYPKTSL